MHDFTDLNAIKKLDPKDALSSTIKLIDQAEAAWNEVNALDIPKTIGEISQIVFCGMGASIYGAMVIKSILGKELPYPTEIVTDYHLPPYVNENTLVVLTSYSGTTEEVLSCAEEAKAMKAHMLVLTKGGPLADFARENNVPAYIFDGKYNPAGVPRLGNGYTVLGLIGLFNKAGIIEVEEHEITNAIIRLKEKFDDLKTIGITDSELFEHKIPVIIAAEHLSGNAQILRNQFNETSKTFSAFYLVPDLNHHLMEGLAFPKKNAIHFIVLNSPNYSPKIKKRMALTIDVIKQNNHIVHEFMTAGQTFYDDFLETLVYGSFLTLYLGYRYNQDPSVNPWVDYFKGKLQEE